jgi:predicted tellurium resistance membrane protein TerC
VSRATWIVTLVLVLALVLMPGFLERYKRVRRALGAVFVFWISLNLWITSLHLSGLGPEGGALRTAALGGPPLLATVLWLYWSRQGRPAA